MIKELEFESETGWYKGHIEVLKDRVPIDTPTTYTISAFIEDKPYGNIWNEVAECNLIDTISIVEKSVMKQLKSMANSNTTEDLLKKKGFDSY